MGGGKRGRVRGAAGRIVAHRSAAAARRGVTLLDLTTVVLILGIVSAIGIPQTLATLEQQRLDAAARRIKLDLDWARRTAKRQNASQTVAFNVNTSSYTLSGVSDLERHTGTYTVALTKYHATLVFVAGSPSGTNVVFTGYGSLTQQATITLSVGALQKSVVVEPTTGTVSIP